MNTKFLRNWSIVAFARKSDLGQVFGQRRDRDADRARPCRRELHNRLEFELTSLDSLIYGFAGR